MSNEHQSYGFSPVSQQEGPTLSNSRVMSVKDWVITIILLAIPIVNIVMLFVWAFGDNVNLNKRNYCRATLWVLLGVIVLYVILFVLLIGAFSAATS